MCHSVPIANSAGDSAGNEAAVLAFSAGRSGMHSRRTERSRLVFTLILGTGVAIPWPGAAHPGKKPPIRGNQGGQFGVS